MPEHQRERRGEAGHAGQAGQQRRDHPAVGAGEPGVADDDEAHEHRREPRDERVVQGRPPQVGADRHDQRPRGPAVRPAPRVRGGAGAEQERRHDDLRQQADEDPRVRLVGVGVPAHHGGDHTEQHGQARGDQPAPGHERDRARDGHGDDGVRLVELPGLHAGQRCQPAAHPEPLRRVEGGGVGVEGVVERGRVGEARDVRDAVELIAREPEQVVRRAVQEQPEVRGGQERGPRGPEQPQCAVAGRPPQEQPPREDHEPGGEGGAEGLGQPAGIGERQGAHGGQGQRTDESGHDESGQEFGGAPRGEAGVGHVAGSAARAVASPTRCRATPTPGPASSAMAERTSSGPGTVTSRIAAAATATHQPAL